MVDQKIFSKKVFRDLFFIFRKLRDQESPENAFPACFDNILKKKMLMEKIEDFRENRENLTFKLNAKVFRVSQSAKNGVKRRVWVLRKKLPHRFRKKFQVFFYIYFSGKFDIFWFFFENFRQLQSQNFFKNFFYFHF